MPYFSSVRLAFISFLAQAIVAILSGQGLAEDSLFGLFSSSYIIKQAEPWDSNSIVVGDRVFILLETSTLPFRLPDQHGSIKDIRGYLVTAELTTPDKINATRTVIGPIYEQKGPMSSIANQAGAAFDSQDREALAQKPYMSFRPSGDLIKSLLSKDKKHWHDWRLQIKGKNAEWIDLGEREVLPLLGRGNDFYIESDSGHFAVQTNNAGKVQIFDLYTSKQIEDQWLTRVASEYFSHHPVATTFLRDDLNSLVIAPAIEEYDAKGNRVELKEFTIHGKTIPCKDHLLIYTRPSEEPQVRECAADPEPVYRGKEFFVGDRLLLRSWTDDYIKFKNLDQQVVLSHKLTESEKWITKRGVWERDDAIHKKLTFRQLQEDWPLKITNFHVATWDYQKDVFSNYSFPLLDLFKERHDGYFPKTVIPIKASAKK